MKIRYIWEEEDIQAGIYICRQSWDEDSKDIAGLCSVTYKLSYLNSFNGDSTGGSRGCMAKTAITDGLVLTYPESSEDARDAKEVFAQALNDDRVGYRLLTNEQVMRRMEHLHGAGAR